MDANSFRETSLDSESLRSRHLLLKVLGGIGVAGLLIALLLPVRRGAGEAARRNSCINQLKQIGLALHNYAEVYGVFPPACTVDVDGRPLHSWRTLILPWMEEVALYNRLDLSKAWDDPVNVQVFKANISAYRCPSSTGPENETTYLAVVAPDGCLQRTEARSPADITDDKAATLVVLEVPAEHAVPWMAPRDADEQMVLAIGPESRLDHLSGVNALFVDGSVRVLSAELSADQRRAMISIAGNEEVHID